jgi:hypothetical protein
MPSLIGTTVTTNYNRVVGPDYTISNGERVYAGPYSNFSTRKLVFASVVGVHNGGAVPFDKFDLAGAGVYTTAGSLFANAVRALQGFGEVLLVGTPGSAGFVVALSLDTVQGNEAASNTQPDPLTFGAMEAAILAATAADTSITVTPLTIGAANGVSIA